MKSLLLLPLFIFLMACGEVEETPNDTITIVEEAVKIFIINKEMLEDEVLIGSLCLLALQDTGSQNNDTCKLYHRIKEQSIPMSKIGLDIFQELINTGVLVEDDTAFLEVIDIVERLAKIERVAKGLRKEINNMSSSGCIKCAI